MSSADPAEDTSITARTAREVVPPQSRVILALGGHEFNRRHGNEAIVGYMATLAPAAPRVCLIPTASGDATDQIAAFRSSAWDESAALSHLSLFRLEHERVSVREHLLAQDLIYVGGGSMVNLLAIWRAHGIDRLLVEAWERGIVIAGQSAGAMCWFSHGVTRSLGRASLVGGLGVISGMLSVHYHRDPDRRERLLRAVRERGLPGWGVDDGAGLLIRGGRVAGAVRGAANAGAWRVERGRDGDPVELELEASALASPRPAIDDADHDVGELRRVRAARAGRGGHERRRRG